MLMLGNIFTYIGRRFRALYEDKIIQVVRQLFDIVAADYVRIIRNAQ